MGRLPSPAGRGARGEGEGRGRARIFQQVLGLGEVSIRVKDLDAMHKFYEEVVGLEVLKRDESFVFFKVAEGYGGHTQNLALFEATNRMFLETKSDQLNPAETTLHHIAINIALEDFES